MQLGVGAVDKTHIHSEWGELRQKLLRPPDFDKKLPQTKARLLENTNAPIAALERFLELGG